MRKKYLKLAEYQKSLSEQHISEVRSMHRQMQENKREFQCHLQILKQYLSEMKYEQAAVYMEELLEHIEMADTSIKTGNNSFDAVFTAKIGQAKKNGIAVTLKAELPDKFTISDDELCIATGHLLDIAIETCRKVKEKKFIRIYIGMKGNLLYFSMRNSSEVRTKKNCFFGKREKESILDLEHGRVQAMIEKHGGWFKYNREEYFSTSEFLVPAAD